MPRAHDENLMKWARLQQSLAFSSGPDGNNTYFVWSKVNLQVALPPKNVSRTRCRHALDVLNKGVSKQKLDILVRV